MTRILSDTEPREVVGLRRDVELALTDVVEIVGSGAGPVGIDTEPRLIAGNHTDTKRVLQILHSDGSSQLTVLELLIVAGQRNGERLDDEILKFIALLIDLH